ncbi:MAG: hypothetical protein HY329_12150 [Chloroflexi bacterium]|nr:hypothetical protein [Chloroflexota bacterium]
MRVWWQSMSAAAHTAGYWPELRKQLQSVAESGTEFDVHGTRVGVVDQHRFFEFLDATSVLANAVQAQRDGYDAFTVGNVLDPGLREIRAMVDMPVLGLGETSMHVACMMGGSFSLIFVNKFFKHRILENVKRYGLEGRLAGFDQIPFDPHAIDRAFLDSAEKERCLGAFIAAARRTIDAGSEVVIPAGGRLISFLEWAGLKEIDGVPVLNGITVLVKMIEMSVKLKHLTGVFVSRHGMYALPPEHLLAKGRDAYRSVYGVDAL